jgi:hypothetical protein
MFIRFLRPWGLKLEIRALEPVVAEELARHSGEQSGRR